jgi:hypothetical protein
MTSDFIQEIKDAETQKAMVKQASQIQRQQNHISELQGKIARQAEAIRTGNQRLYEVGLQLGEAHKERDQAVTEKHKAWTALMQDSPNCVPETRAPYDIAPGAVQGLPNGLKQGEKYPTSVWLDYMRPQPGGILKNVGPSAPVVTNEAGGKQSKVDYRFDLLPAKATFAVAGVLDHGAKKYAPWNWLKIGEEEHVNHALIHLFAWLDGDKQDDHMSHAACRVMMALEKTLEPPKGSGNGCPECGDKKCFGRCSR